MLRDLIAGMLGAVVALAGVWVGMLGQGWSEHWKLHYKLRKMSRGGRCGHLHCSTCGRWFPGPPPDFQSTKEPSK